VTDAAEFVRSVTVLRPTPFVPEVRLHLADEAIALWERTEAESGRDQPPPFWAFAWAGGQALARYVRDEPSVVAGRTVLDVAAGSGLVAIAAALAGAVRVTANEIDPYAVTAIGLNAAANGVPVEVILGDVLDGDGAGFDVILAGDVFYSRAMALRMARFFERARKRGALVLVGDPGRAYRPVDGFTEAAAYEVPVNSSLEDAEFKAVTVLVMRPSTP